VSNFLCGVIGVKEYREHALILSYNKDILSFYVVFAYKGGEAGIGAKVVGF
jgi:hypothetical protein